MQWRLTSSTTAIVNMATNVTAPAALCGAAKSSSRVNLAAEESRETPAFLPITVPQAKHTKEVASSKRSFEETKQPSSPGKTPPALHSLPPPYPTGD